LKTRFLSVSIYTFVSDILIALNPYKEIPLYNENQALRYRTQAIADDDSSNSTPHIFAVAERGYHGLVQGQKKQCCLISGESGAGKTETAKFFINHLLWLEDSREDRIQEHILQLSPILEAFGNARTVHNDNSSRFGKYIQVGRDPHRWQPFMPDWVVTSDEWDHECHTWVDPDNRCQPVWASITYRWTPTCGNGVSLAQFDVSSRELVVSCDRTRATPSHFPLGKV